MKRGEPPSYGYLELIFSLTLLLIFLCPLRAVCDEVPRITWEHVHPYPSGSWLNGVAWGPPGFVAVGSGGEILHSEDGYQWQRVEVSEVRGVWLAAVHFYGGKFVAIGERRILVSEDGRQWTVSHLSTDAQLRSCAGGDGKWIVTTDQDFFFVSTNGTDWESRQTPVSFVTVAHGNDFWLGLTGGPDFYASPDLENWILVESRPPSGNGGPFYDELAFGNGRFVVAVSGVSRFGGAILSSSNAIDWVASVLDRLVPDQIAACTFAAGRFLAVQQKGFLTSMDGVIWQSLPSPDPRETLNGIAGSDSGTFVAVGTQGSVLTSTNAAHWDLISANPREDIHTVAYGNGRFVAVGGSRHNIGYNGGSAAALMSKNAHTWHGSLTNLDNLLYTVAYGNGLWVAYGGQRQVFISLDASRWIRRDLPAGTEGLERIVFGNGRFLAFPTDGDRIYSSVTGFRWSSKRFENLKAVYRLKFVNKRFFAFGANGMLLSSADGTKWKRSTLPTSGLSTIAFGNGRYVAGGWFVLAHSNDGQTWTAQASPFQMRDVVFVNGWFMAVGNRGEIQVSRDGLEWHDLASPLRGWSGGIPAVGKNTVVIGEGVNLYRGTFE